MKAVYLLLRVRSVRRPVFMVQGSGWLSRRKWAKSRPETGRDRLMYRLDSGDEILARPSEGYPDIVLGAVTSFLVPFGGHLSPKVVQTLKY